MSKAGGYVSEDNFGSFGLGSDDATVTSASLGSFSLPNFFLQLTQQFVGLFLYDDAVLWKMRQYVNVVSELKALRPVVITTRNTLG